MVDKIHDIHERIYQFIRMVLALLRGLPKTYQNEVIIQQLVRSITSVGANDQEADGSFTRADFIHCYTIARKEIKESIFWIRLIGDENTKITQKAASLIKEGDEIMRIITAIILATKKNK